MTQDEIIEMARQAQSVYGTDTWTFALCANQLEAFAKLVAAKEREVCDAICKDAYEWAAKKLNQTTNAKEDSHWAGRMRQAQDIGNAIRARGEA